MRLLLGVDGGGTGCRVRLTDGEGQILAQAEGGPANVATDFETSVVNIGLGIAQVLELAGLGTDVLPETRACLGLAGVNVSDAAARLRARLPFRQVLIYTDAVTTTHGALAGQDGIVAAIGTGSVFAEMRGGAFRQIGGWGHVLGDQGSGAHLGRAILAEALLAHDGLRPMTPLLTRLHTEFKSPDHIGSFSLRASAGEIATYARYVVEAADDPAALQVFASAAEGVIAHIDKLQSAGPLPVTWLGGLGPIWAKRLSGRWRERPAVGAALDGAIALARGL